MADIGKVPGMRKNGEPLTPEEEIDLIPADQLVDAVNVEIANWHAQGLDPGNVQFNLHAMDVQLNTVVWFLIDEGYITQDEFNERYRRKMLKTLQQQRSDITKAQITAPTQSPELVVAKGMPKI